MSEVKKAMCNLCTYCNCREIDMSEVIIYEDTDGHASVQVRLDGETVWLTQKQMADLFESGTDNIGLHLKNIYAEGKLSESATAEGYSVVQTEGKR